MIDEFYSEPGRAWIAQEYLAGRTQKDIGFELNVSSAAICIQIATFLRAWSGRKNLDGIYNELRRKLCQLALRHYLFETDGSILKPEPREGIYHRQIVRYNSVAAYYRARHEHAWLLRAEGETFRQIGERLGVSKSRAAQMVYRFGSKVRRAISKTEWTIHERTDRSHAHLRGPHRGQGAG